MTDKYAEVATALVKQLGLQTQMSEEIAKVLVQNLVTFDKKQLDYGSGNISSFGELGVLVRANDKVERLKNLWNKGNMNPHNEAVSDSWLDLANYGLIGYLCNKKLWK